MLLPSAISSRLRNLPGPIRAGLWITLSSTGFTGMMAIARELSSDLPIPVIVLFRSLFGLAFLSPYVMRNGIGALRTTRIGLYLMRGFCAYTGLTCLFFAVTYISLAEVSAINFTRPIFGSIAAILFLGEVARARRWVAIFAGFAGALIIIRPGFQDLNPGVLFALGSVAVQVVNTVVVKRLSRTEPPDAIAIYQGLVFAPMAAAAASLVWQMPNLEQFAWLCGMGALGAITQRAMPRAYVAADATLVISFDLIRLPIAALLGFVFFAEVPVIWVWIGGAVIFAASVFIAHRESSTLPGARG